MEHGLQIGGRAGGRVCGRLLCPHLVKILHTVQSLCAGLERGWDLALLQLVPVDAAEEGMIHDCLAAFWAVAQPLLNIPYKQALQQALCIAAQKRCSTVQSCSGMPSKCHQNDQSTTAAATTTNSVQIQLLECHSGLVSD